MIGRFAWASLAAYIEGPGAKSAVNAHVFNNIGKEVVWTQAKVVVSTERAAPALQRANASQHKAVHRHLCHAVPGLLGRQLERVAGPWHGPLRLWFSSRRLAAELLDVALHVAMRAHALLVEIWPGSCCTSSSGTGSHVLACLELVLPLAFALALDAPHPAALAE